MYSKLWGPSNDGLLPAELAQWRCRIRHADERFDPRALGLHRSDERAVGRVTDRPSLTHNDRCRRHHRCTPVMPSIGDLVNMKTAII